MKLESCQACTASLQTLAITGFSNSGLIITWAHIWLLSGYLPLRLTNTEPFFILFSLIYPFNILQSSFGKICILLSIITFGIYGIYWLYLLVKNTRSIQKNTTSCTGEMLCLIFVPFYSLYWWYTRGEKVKQEFSQHNYASTGNGIVYLIFAIFGFIHNGKPPI